MAYLLSVTKRGKAALKTLMPNNSLDSWILINGPLSLKVQVERIAAKTLGHCISNLGVNSFRQALSGTGMKGREGDGDWKNHALCV